MFLYAGTHEQAEKARNVIEWEASRQGWRVDVDFRHWHPIAEDWEDPNKALPDDVASELSERESLMGREREETARRGYPEFEVRVDLLSRRDAVSLFKQLRKEGLPAVHRWRYLLVGATDEDSAKALAERIRTESPTASRIRVEGTWTAVSGDRGLNPFAVFGGLGG